MTENSMRPSSGNLQSVTVYCGSSLPPAPEYAEAAEHLGRYLAQHRITLIYGGTSEGTMKLLADAQLRNGGRAVGVFTRDLSIEKLQPNLTEVHIVNNLAERKALMLAKADAVIALPGSLGTLDELFDALAQIKIGAKSRTMPIGVLNVSHYYDRLFEFLAHSGAVGFTHPQDTKMLLQAETPEELFAAFAQARLPR